MKRNLGWWSRITKAVARVPHICLFVLTTWSLGGCSDSTDTVDIPRLDPQTVAKAALAAYDTDGDGKLKSKELKACEALQRALRRIDTNRDRAIDANELVARLQSYGSNPRPVPVYATVNSRGGPVIGATVVFEPESFQGENLLSIDAKTSELGVVLYEKIDVRVGIPPGFYRVRITTPDGNETVRGVEVARDNRTLSHLDFDTR